MTTLPGEGQVEGRLEYVVSLMWKELDTREEYQEGADDHVEVFRWCEKLFRAGLTELCWLLCGSQQCRSPEKPID